MLQSCESVCLLWKQGGPIHQPQAVWWLQEGPLLRCESRRARQQNKPPPPIILFCEIGAFAIHF